MLGTSTRKYPNKNYSRKEPVEIDMAIRNYLWCLER